jgi:hypothetical protein
VLFHTSYSEFSCSLTTSPKSHCIVHDVFRALVPEPHERIPITGTNTSYLLLPFLPLIYMGYLARRPDTFTLRLLLLPLVVAVAVGTYFRFMWTEPQHNIYNWGQGIVLPLSSYLYNHSKRHRSTRTSHKCQGNRFCMEKRGYAQD